MATDPKRENENELQPDPMLKQGRSSKVWVWTIGIAILAAVAITFLAVTDNDNQQTATPPGQHPGAITTGSSEPPTPALPAGRTSSSAPKRGEQDTVR